MIAPVAVSGADNTVRARCAAIWAAPDRTACEARRAARAAYRARLDEIDAAFDVARRAAELEVDRIMAGGL